MTSVEPAQPSRPANLPTLTALRFFAALWVVLYHFSDHLPLEYSSYNPLLWGTQAVNFFFILSGFIIAHVYGNQIKSGSFAMWPYLRKRLARVYPVHLFTLVAIYVIYIAARKAGQNLGSPDQYQLKALPANVLMLHGWLPGVTPSFNIPSWSISAEFFAYLTFPLFAGLILRRGSTMLWLGVSVLLTAATIAVVRLAFHMDVFRMITMSIFRIAPLFFVGIVLWRGWSEGKWRLPTIALPIAAVAAVALSSIPVATIPLFAIVVLAAAEMGDRQNWLTSKPMIMLGEASYSLYMTHALVQIVYFGVLKVLKVSLTSLPVALCILTAGVVLSVIVSLITWKLVEIPARNLATRKT
jgi:peptidoglycan/LPS O-acetylase OafA/YrhL